MMDLATLDLAAGAEAGVEVELTHPVTGRPLGAKLKLRGTDAPTYRAALLEQRRRRIEFMTKSGRDRLDPADLDAEALELLAAATVGWSGMTLDGKPFDYSHENAATLYRRFGWVREQAAAAIADRANFLPRSATD
jgi:hypothetical protein